MLTVEMKDTINEIVEEYGGKQSSIITILQKIQMKYRYLPEEDRKSTRLNSSHL